MKSKQKLTTSKGLKYDLGKAPLGLLSSAAMTKIAKVLDFGRQKYSAHNWRKGIEWSRVYDALQRHLVAWNSGEIFDKESGQSHLAHAGCCLMFLLEFEDTHKHLDDRYKVPKKKQPKAK